MNYEIPKNAIIENVREDFFIINDTTYDGLRVTTNKGDIMIAITEYTQCCEEHGAMFLETPDDTSKFIGAKILSVDDVCIRSVSDVYEGLDDACETQLRITTDRGVLQYAIYNSHSGGYDHATLVQVFDNIEENCL